MIVSIFEQKILVDKDWKPNDGLIMHVATFGDYGINKGAEEYMEEEGLKPVERVLRITCEFVEE